MGEEGLMAIIAVEAIDGKTSYVIHAGGERCLSADSMTEAVLACLSAGIHAEVFNA